ARGGPGQASRVGLAVVPAGVEATDGPGVGRGGDTRVGRGLGHSHRNALAHDALATLRAGRARARVHAGSALAERAGFAGDAHARRLDAATIFGAALAGRAARELAAGHADPVLAGRAVVAGQALAKVDAEPTAACLPVWTDHALAGADACSRLTALSRGAGDVLAAGVDAATVRQAHLAGRASRLEARRQAGAALADLTGRAERLRALVDASVAVVVERVAALCRRAHVLHALGACPHAVGAARRADTLQARVTLRAGIGADDRA